MMGKPARRSDPKPVPRHQWLRKELWYGAGAILAILAAWAFSANYRLDNAPGPPVGQVPAVKPPPRD